MILDEIMSHNRDFVRQARPPALSPEPTRHACVVACMDSRLVDHLTRALGVGRGEVDLICTAGNTITPHDNAILRSVAVSCILHGVKEVLVVGHADCGMASDVLPLTEAMEAAGISRGDVGSVDLREFFGLTPSPETNVRQVVDTLRRSMVIPPEVVIHGLLLEDRTGALRLVVRGAPAPPRRRGEAPRLPEADLDAARTPEVHVTGEAIEPVAVLLGPSAPATEPPRTPPPSAPPGILLRPSPPAGKSEKAEPIDVDIDLGPVTPKSARKPAAKREPVAAPPPTPMPAITIDVTPQPPTAGKASPKRPPSPARRGRKRQRPTARPVEKGDLDIRLGPAKRRRPPRR